MAKGGSLCDTRVGAARWAGSVLRRGAAPHSAVLTTRQKLFSRLNKPWQSGDLLFLTNSQNTLMNMIIRGLLYGSL